MLAKLFILLGIAGTILLLLLDTAPSNTDLQLCSSQISTNYYLINSYIDDRKWDPVRACRSRAEQLQFDQECIQKVFDSRITAEYIFWVSEHRTAINKIIHDYRDWCGKDSIQLYEIDLGRIRK